MGLTSRKDMISCIQEWFAQEYTLKGVTTLYYDLRSEIEAQLEFMLDEVAKTNSKDGLYEEGSNGRYYQQTGGD